MAEPPPRPTCSGRHRFSGNPQAKAPREVPEPLLIAAGAAAGFIIFALR